MVVDVTAGAELALSGRLDVQHASPTCGTPCTPRIDAGTGDLVVDVSGVELIDATGLGVLLGAAPAGRAAGPPPRAARRQPARPARSCG